MVRTRSTSGLCPKQGRMEVKLKSSDGTTRSVQVQAMDSREDRTNPVQVTSSPREKRNGEPLLVGEIGNPRKRARSTSPVNEEAQSWNQDWQVERKSEWIGEEDSSDSEEDLPPGDRVAYIHVGEGGEADLEAQLKGRLRRKRINSFR